MAHQQLIPHLFRSEFSKITAVLCKRFGLDHISIAEDIAGDTFLAALETWTYSGVPENPTAWLYTVAKNKTKNYLRRHQTGAEKLDILAANSPSITDVPETDWSAQNIADSQLQMLFAVCHPVNPPEAQTGLALRILCGFGIDEIADAFLTNKSTINKRLFRAKEKLRQEKIALECPGPDQLSSRLEPVLTTLYLLFNEGYYAERQDEILRKDLCLEAMRLTHLLLDHPETRRPEAGALLALMCFNASRFEARKNQHGDVILYDDQDTSLWDETLIAKGACLLHESSGNGPVTWYHLEAGIAYWYTRKTDTPEKWESILSLYNRLLMMAYSPVAALNRTFVLSKVYGNAVAIAAAEKLELTENPFYFTLLGTLYRDTDVSKAKMNFEQALVLAKNNTDRRMIRYQIDLLTPV